MPVLCPIYTLYHFFLIYNIYIEFVIAILDCLIAIRKIKNGERKERGGLAISF